MEEFRTIKSEPDYEISNLGNLRKKGSDKNIKLIYDRDGYLTKNINHHIYRIHRLVALEFLEDTGLNPDGSIMKGNHLINHKNEIKDDNRVENLEWCDNTYNMNYGSWPSKDSLVHIGNNNHMYGKTWKSGKNKKLKGITCIELNKTFSCAREVSEWLNVPNAYKQLPTLCKNQNLTGWGYHWKYTI